MGSSGRKAGKALLGFVKAVSLGLLVRPTVQSTIRGQIRKIFTGSREKPYKEIPDVEQLSFDIIKLLENRIPDDPCIGIDGMPGSGKSTLARSLSTKMNLGHRTLYSKELTKKFDFDRSMIYENMRLFRTQDIDNFDVIIYFDLSIEEAKSRVMERDRNGSLIDYLHFGKLKRIGKMAFENAAGEKYRIGNAPVYLKIRQPNGYQLDDAISKLLLASGQRIENIGLEEKLFLLCYGKAEHGLWPYANLIAYRKEFAQGIKAAIDEMV